MTRHANHHQTGQAMPLGLALLAAGCLGALVLYNTGQVATDKARLANAADAAAYSGLVWQARAMNFQAYTNRAMVANQVSIGQAVTLNSWVRYGDTTARRINTVLGGIPYIGAFTNGVAQVMAGIQQVVDPVTRAIVAVVDSVTTGLSHSQEAMYASSFVATPDVVRKLVAASDPRFDVDTAYSMAGLYGNLDGWSAFTDSFGSDDVDDMRGRGDVITESRDGFTERRDWELFEGIWFYSTPLSSHNVIREGQTHLAMREENGEVHWEWMAKDTLSFQTVLLRPWKWRRRDRKKEIELEIGWGEAFANDEQDDSWILSECDRDDREPECAYVDWNRRAEGRADDDRGRIRHYDGVKAFRSLSEAAREQEDKDPKLRLRIEVAMPDGETPTANEWVVDEPFVAPVATPGDTLSSVSVAEVHYRRPDAYEPASGTRSREAANGYNPYWEVRLAPVSAVDRLGAVAARQLVGGGGGTEPDSGDTRLGSYDIESPVDGIGDAADGLGSSLAAYPTTLAGAFGVEGADLSIADVSLEDVAGLALGDPIDAFRDGLEEELRSVPERIFTSAVNSAIDNTVGVAEQAIADSPAAATVAGWAEEALALNEEFEAIQDDVRDDFEVAFEAGVTRYNTTVGPFLTDIEVGRRALENYEARLDEGLEYVEGEAQRLRDVVDGIELQLKGAQDELVESLRLRLIDIIRDHAGGAAWAVDLASDVTSGTIEIMLDDYFEEAGTENLEELLTWTVD